MSDTSRLSKLAELRVKTDRQLAGLIDRALNRSLASGTMFQTSAYAETSALLAKVEDPGERWRLDNKLQRLRAALNDRRLAGRPRLEVAGCGQSYSA